MLLSESNRLLLEYYSNTFHPNWNQMKSFYFSLHIPSSFSSFVLLCISLSTLFFFSLLFRSFSCLHLRVSMVAWVGIECVRQISHCMEWPSEHFNMWRVHDGSTLDYFSFPCVSTLVPHPSLSFGWGSGMCGMCWNVMWYERDISCVLNHSIVLD
jgi:hypothetical protein